MARSSGWQRPAAAVVVVLGALAGLVCAMIWPVTAVLLGAVLLTCAIALRAPVAGFLLALLVVGCEGLLKAGSSPRTCRPGWRSAPWRST